MKRLIFITIVCVFMAKPSIADLSFSYEYASDTDGTLTCPIPGAIIDNFDSDRPGWTYNVSPYDNGSLVGPGDVYVGGTQIAAAPYNYITGFDDATHYYTVPVDVTDFPQSAAVVFGEGTYNYLGLFWGSMDNYNSIDFYLGSFENSPVATVTGSQVSLDSANGGQTDPLDNAYVNIYGIPDFDRIKLTSTNYAFEFDNLAVVPVPAAVILGVLGLGVAGIKLRKYA